MSYTFSRALVEEFWRATSSDGDVSAPLNSTPTPDQSWWPDKTTEHSRLSRFGMTFGPLTGVRGEVLLKWWLVASRARTSALLATETASMASVPASGASSRGWFAKYDQSELKWKTAQCSLVEGLDEFSETWPRWGSMLNGASFLRPIPALPICESASGLWPTPTVCGNYNRPGASATSGMGLASAVKLWPTPCARDYRFPGKSRLERTGSKAGEVLPQIVGGPLNPDWTEWLMGWPIGWTDLKPLGTGKFLEWQQQHSAC